MSALEGGDRSDPVIRVEYAAEGSIAPMVMIREGAFKLNLSGDDPVQFFDLANDPHELNNLAHDPVYAGKIEHFRKHVTSRWDLAQYDAEVRRSQIRRLAVYEALRNGNYYPWDFQPLQKASERYMRNHMDLNTVESDARFPKKGE